MPGPGLDDQRGGKVLQHPSNSEALQTPPLFMPSKAELIKEVTLEMASQRMYYLHEASTQN